MAERLSDEHRSPVSGTEFVEKVTALFAGEGLFRLGLAAGVESETYTGREDDERLRDSPIRLLATMPAWEGSHRLRRREQNLVYSIGAVVGAFAQRAGIEIPEEPVDPIEAEMDRRAAMVLLFGGARTMIDVAVEQGHGDTPLLDLPNEVIDESYERRHQGDTTQV